MLSYFTDNVILVLRVPDQEGDQQQQRSHAQQKAQRAHGAPL